MNNNNQMNQPQTYEQQKDIEKTTYEQHNIYERNASYARKKQMNEKHI